MGRLTCRCLNVCVHSKGPSWDARPVAADVLFPEGLGARKGKKRERLAGETLWEIELDVAGVTAEQRGLLLTHVVGDWVIHTCSNCDTDVYVVHSVKEEGRTFVTKLLLSDPSEIQLLTRHENYSPVFRIVLQLRSEEREEEETGFGRKRLSSMTFGREDPVMKVVHAQMKSFLNQEEENLERRIRIFESAQREAFSQLQKRAHKERALLFSAIAHARANGISDAMNDAPKYRASHPSSALPPHPYTTSPKLARGRGEGGRRGEGERVSPEQQKVTITVNVRRLEAPKDELSSSLPPADDAMFALEGFDEEGYDEGGGRVDLTDGAGVAFPQSDDEEISTDDSSFRDVSSLNTAGMAYSVPVGIPMFPRQSSTATEPESPSEDQFNPADVCNSIKALALSVQDTGMFGDLPKPRIYSAPYAR